MAELHPVMVQALSAFAPKPNENPGLATEAYRKTTNWTQYNPPRTRVQLWTWAFADGTTCGHDHPSQRAAHDCHERIECATHRHMAATLLPFNVEAL